MIKHSVHHQLKYLVLHGFKFHLELMLAMHVKVMEQHGHGEEMVMDH